jgi:hypothetical protein
MLNLFVKGSSLSLARSGTVAAIQQQPLPPSLKNGLSKHLQVLMQQRRWNSSVVTSNESSGGSNTTTTTASMNSNKIWNVFLSGTYNVDTPFRSSRKS